MKKLLCAILLLALTVCCTAALAEECKYAGQGDSCDVKWWVDTKKMEHCRACFYHVEDKEDMNSHVPVTAWAACTVNQSTGKCSVCGWQYQSAGGDDSAENAEKYLLEYFFVYGAEAGTAPVKASVSGDTLSIAFAKNYRNAMLEKGYMSEGMMVDTEYTLTLPGGSTYAYEGVPVTPEVEVTASEYGPGAFLQKNKVLTIGDPVYSNNDQPGTATVSVNISVKRGETYTLTKTFTIEGAEKRIPGDANGNERADLNDAIAILRHCAGGSVSINQANSDVNGDNKVNIYDALRILQYVAGWNVTLE